MNLNQNETLISNFNYNLSTRPVYYGDKKSKI